jgi:hypothetical protein
MRRTETDCAHTKGMQGQSDGREDRADALRKAAAAAGDVPTLCRALNQLDALCGRDLEGLTTIPVFSTEPDIDWSEFVDEAVSCDESYVLFKEHVTGRYYYKDRSEVEEISY